MMMITAMTAIMSTMIMALCKLISKTTTNDREKSTPFECGFDPSSSARMPFSVHFFLLTVLFLIFDIELAILMPIILTMKWGITSKWVMTVMLFLIILVSGLYHEWNNNMLEWTN
uniref:NADH-ubiquinone oxidoreductase chain 3 n=1 Tax=Scaptocoris castanea TaxID=1411909 RepID=A0A343YVR0_9HEMI|nr:NADH dehydrogenase subunit 3 [Scaptocoris castanea]